ncbi:sulfotransferase domain-containing protein [Coraliomargarita sp. SDUM461003]|uniref:Sulfotransferase domain-containing protein n=1 Tax=Thalassobacterium maritimum TaxID=3041265 RepID=A0ABU1AZ69_9BACT|nr:sulfotransferase domain-containing protein [Coraliomargarita sp. SDUM461003]MDQ8208554.1 sulfotransferase domain-containing protein [Coraliomargarita sp. SDUM461003]
MDQQAHISHRICEKVNPYLTRYFGKPLKQIQVVEYPKCGGTWLARMLRSYLGVERKHGTTHLPKHYSVYQTHLLHNTQYYRNIALLRDPRDVWVSFYFHERYLSKESIFGFKDTASHPENMLAYMKHKLARADETTPGFTYTAFVNSWQNKAETCWVRYEEMHQNPVAALSKALQSLGLEPDQPRVEAAVKEHEFKNITGRKIGEEDVSSHKRKGIVGDWKNYFNQEMAQLVHHEQPLLYQLGYEKDSTWLDHLG